MSDEDGVPVVERLTAEQVRAICHAYRVPAWVAGLAPRPSWPTWLRYWLRQARWRLAGRPLGPSHGVVYDGCQIVMCEPPATGMGHRPEGRTVPDVIVADDPYNKPAQS